jgi:DNA-binding SARP family transcriptional activator
MPVLNIRRLGDFRLIYGDEPLTAFARARQPSLLAYLLLHRGAPRSRPYLTCLFWPDTGAAFCIQRERGSP